MHHFYIMNHKPKPQIVTPFSPEILQSLSRHVEEVRRLFDWPGIPYHDKDVADGDKFNRWYWHNLPLLKALHNSKEFVRFASEHFGRDLMPSYSFLSMYGPEGVCPIHTDRPQCQYTIDLCLRSDGEWPIYVDDEEFISKPGEALAYSGTGQVHYRKPMRENGTCKFMDLAFFHFVPTDWQGPLS